MDILELRSKLVRLGHWASDHGIMLGYPSETPFNKLRGKSISAASISDDEAKIYCELLRDLREHDELMWDAVQTHSVFNKPLPRGHRSHLVRKRVENGEYWVLATLLRDQKIERESCNLVVKNRMRKYKVIGHWDKDLFTSTTIYRTKLIPLP